MSMRANPLAQDLAKTLRKAAAAATPEPLLRLLHKPVRIRFIFGGEATGQLIEVWKYELVLGVAPGQSIVVFKGAVQTVEEVQK